MAEAEHNLALLTDGSDGPNWLVSLVLVVLAWGGARILGEYAPQIAEWVDRGPAWLVLLMWLPLMLVVLPMRFVRNFWIVIEALMLRLSDNPRVVFPILVNQVVTFLCLIVAVGLAFFLNRPLLGLLSYFVFVWLGTRVGSDADAPADAN